MAIELVRPMPSAGGEWAQCSWTHPVISGDWEIRGPGQAAGSDKERPTVQKKVDGIPAFYKHIK